MGYVVFAQAANGRIDAARLIANARSYFFHLTVEVLDEQGVIPGGAPPESTTLRLEVAARGSTSRFSVATRPATRDDRADAEMAEARGQATGMALLAARCGFVWQVEPEGEVPDDALLDLCGLLASVALGPVMPPDKDTLYGVRGARERAEKLRKQRGTYR